MPSKRDLDKDKMFRKIMPSSAPPERGETAAPEGGKLSQDAIAALFARQRGGAPIPEPQSPRPPIQPPTGSVEGGKLSVDAIAALFAQVGDDVPEPESDPEVIALDTAGDTAGGRMSQDAIAALFARQGAESAAAPEHPRVEAATLAQSVAQEAAPSTSTPASEPTQAPQQTSSQMPQKVPKLDIADMYAQQHARTLAESAGTANDFELLDHEIEAAFQGMPVPKHAAEPRPVQTVPAAVPLPPAAPAPEPAPQPVVAAAPPQPQPPPQAKSGEVYPEAPAPKPAPPVFDEAPYPVNPAEVVAELYYPCYRQKFNGCHCDKCRDDVLGMTLNRMKPHYITSDQMDPALLQERALITECVTALIRALFVVKRNPKHDSMEAMRRG